MRFTSVVLATLLMASGEAFAAEKTAEDDADNPPASGSSTIVTSDDEDC
jgi:hypothetical protein